MQIAMKAAAVAVAAVTCGFAVAQPASQKDLLVRFKEGVTLSDRRALQDVLGATKASEVPSVGAQLLRFRPDADPQRILERAMADSRLEFVDVGLGDYRKPLVPLADSAPLDAATSAAVDRFRTLASNANAKLFRLRSEDLVERMLSKGFGTKDALAVPNSMVIDLPGLPSTVLVRSGPVEGADGSTSWTGSVSTGAPGALGAGSAGFAQLTYRDGKLLGNVVANGAVFRVTPIADGVHAVVPVESLPPEHPPGAPPVRLKMPAAGADAMPKNKDAAPTEVSVVIGVTEAAAARIPDLQLMEAQLVNQFNTVAMRSKVDVRLRSLGIRKVGLAEAGIDADLKSMMASDAMAEFRGWRRQLRANIGIVLTTSSDYCGLAAAIGADARTAMAVVNDRCALDNFSFTHELGHLFGARHDFESDGSTQPHAYAHGYATGTIRSVMAYPDSCGPSAPRCVRQMNWSNPGVRVEGRTFGTANRHHNARVVVETAPVIGKLVAEDDPQ